jgi:uncharacterized phage protein (TIGR02216 family)
MTRPAAPFPWDEIMAFGFRVLRLSPDAFWSLTPLEVHAAMGRGGGPLAPPRRRDLAGLMAAFPDRRRGSRGAPGETDERNPL